MPHKMSFDVFFLTASNSFIITSIIGTIIAAVDVLFNHMLRSIAVVIDPARRKGTLAPTIVVTFSAIRTCKLEYLNSISY